MLYHDSQEVDMVRPLGKKKTVYAALRIDPVTNQLWEDTARALGMSKTALMEMAIRKLARAEGIPERQIPEEGNADGSE
jgi:hypothetical protein